IESEPTDLDAVRREIMRLQIERESLKNEKDPASRERLAKLDKELADRQEEMKELQARWQTEKESTQRLANVREAIERTRQELEDAQYRGDFAKASELKYGQLPALEQKLKEEEKQLAEKDGQAPLVKKEVDEEDIAAVVSRWTGIPVSK